MPHRFAPRSTCGAPLRGVRKWSLRCLIASLLVRLVVPPIGCSKVVDQRRPPIALFLVPEALAGLCFRTLYLPPLTVQSHREKWTNSGVNRSIYAPAIVHNFVRSHVFNLHNFPAVAINVVAKVNFRVPSVSVTDDGEIGRWVHFNTRVGNCTEKWMAIWNG